MRTERRDEVEAGLVADLDAAFASREAAGLARGRDEGFARGRDRGRDEGLARERELLRSQAALKFGAEAARDISALLAGCGPDALQAAGCCLIECAAGAEAVGCIRAIARRAGNGGFHA